MHRKFLQTRTKLAARELHFLWHVAVPAAVNEVDRHTNTHTCSHTDTLPYVHASVPDNKAKRGQWGLMPLQLERLTVSHKVFVLTAYLPNIYSAFLLLLFYIGHQKERVQPWLHPQKLCRPTILTNLIFLSKIYFLMPLEQIYDSGEAGI